VRGSRSQVVADTSIHLANRGESGGHERHRFLWRAHRLKHETGAIADGGEEFSEVGGHVSWVYHLGHADE
jgi:hypothetical protein